MSSCPPEPIELSIQVLEKGVNNDPLCVIMLAQNT